MSSPPRSGRNRTTLLWALGCAAALGAGVLIGSALTGGTADPPPLPDESPPTALSSDSNAAVRASMRRVHYRVFPDVALEIAFLRGALVPTRAARPVSFDDPASFTIAIDTGQIAIDTADLSGLLNQFVFRYHGAALHDLHAATEGGRLRLHGKIHKLISLPFTIVASVGVTREGIITLHPDEVRLLGIGVKGLLRSLSVELDDLVKSNHLHGIRVAGNDLQLDPTELLPPPRIRGRLTALVVESRRVVQVFGRRDAQPFTPVPVLGPAAIAFRGGRLQFGRLTMTDTDMRIIRPDTAGRFDFFLGRYLQQLTAGYHVTTESNGLDVVMPDYADAARGVRLHPDRRRETETGPPK